MKLRTPLTAPRAPSPPTRRARGAPLSSAFAWAAAIAGLLAAKPSQAAIPTCPATSTTSSWVGSFLDTDTDKAGVLYDNGNQRLRLQGLGGDFKQSVLGTSDTVMYAAAADFDKDGWTDFVGGDQSTNFQLKYYANHTYLSPEPDWSNPAAVRAPKFIKSAVVDTFTYASASPTILVAGDFNGDTWADVVEINAPKATATNYEPTRAVVLLNSARNVGPGARFLTPYNAFKAPTTSRSVGYQEKEGTTATAVDYNGDRKLDLILSTSAGGGTIRIFLNNCTSPTKPPSSGLIPCTDAPTFSYYGDLINNLGFLANSQDGLPIFAYQDFDGDGYRDLIVGAPGCCAALLADRRLRLFRGVSGGGLSSTPQVIKLNASTYFTGSAIGIYAADYSLDGKADIIVATDGYYPAVGTNIGGQAFYWQNNGSSTPFSDPYKTLIASRGSGANQTTDFDVGFVFNYDNDPWNTPDVMIADGNDSAKYFVFANRAVDKYVACGDAASGIFELGSLSDTEMVVTAGRITPEATLNGGTIKYYMSNEDPPNWVLATACPGSSTDLCVSFPRQVGREIRWKAVMCSNSTQTTTPTLRDIAAKFDYQRSREHYRAGVIVNDGISYVGAFNQPGNRGNLYAINAALNTTYWDAGSKLDATADGARNIYTSGRTTATRLDFTAANAANALLKDTLMTTNTTAVANIITWARSFRFGVGNSGIPLTRLGSVETSTPAIVTRPGRPTWYAHGGSSDRSRFDVFIAQNQTRVPLLLFGAKDGMIHALHTRPTDIGNSINGTEAWAYVPPRVAAGMLADYTNSQSGTTTVASYPDGSPTVADWHAGNGVVKTVAIVASGNGGKSITALDITQTVDPSSGVVLGPQPMWSAVPGDSDAGQALTKPVIARVLLSGVEKYVVVAGTGDDYVDTTDTLGRVIAGYDLATGAVLWKFRAKCPLTSDLSAFETDDAFEVGAPTLDGYIDRVVFADKCGYVYKINPAANLAGGWYQNTGMGTISTGTVDGKVMYALFSTLNTARALGATRPIAGTIAARTDASSRMVLFFGTGGMEDYAVGVVNEFYAVYADSGTVRSKITGTCSGGRCEKFYGGVVVTPEQVVLTRTIDAQIGTAACDTGTSKVQALELNANAASNFVEDFVLQLSSAVVGSLYGDAGAMYFATMSGDVVRVGTPRSPQAGGDTSSGSTPTMGAGDPLAPSTGTTSPLTLIGWREVM